MIDRNLLQKLVDEHIKYLHSPIWAILKYRLLEYQKRQQEYMKNHIRNKDWDTVARTQGIIDGIDEVIKLTERLDRDLKENTLDVDAALHVIENKVE
jgi:hypothetical protein